MKLNWKNVYTILSYKRCINLVYENLTNRKKPSHPFTYDILQAIIFEKKRLSGDSPFPETLKN